MGIYLFRVQNSTASTVSLLFGFLSSMRLHSTPRLSAKLYLQYTIQRDSSYHYTHIPKLTLS